MPRIATALRGLAALALLLAALPAAAQQPIQDVTVDQLTALPQANIDQLMALPTTAPAADFQALLTNDLVTTAPANPETHKPVRFTAVVLSDPRNSGMASINTETGVPNRIHFFVRDTAALSEGPDGMTIQVVDETRSGASLPLRVGDVIEVEGLLTVFRSGATAAWQVAPLDADALLPLGSVFSDEEFEPYQAILGPVTVTTDELNRVVGEVGGNPVVQTNWANWNRLNGQYVRVEGAVITNSEENPTGRPNWSFMTPGTDAQVMRGDISLRYRNDRSTLGAPFFSRPANNPYVPPVPNSLANVQGFVVLQTFDAFNLGAPAGMFLSVNPMTDDDVQVTVGPPIVGIQPITAVPSGDITIEATAEVTGEDPLSSLVLSYAFFDEDGEAGATGDVEMTPVAGTDRFAATIPVTSEEDGSFVRYTVTATDAANRTTVSREVTTRVLTEGITQISHVQRTAAAGPGDSPFVGLTTDMDIEGVVMTDPATSGLISVQDDPELGPWSGVFVVATEALRAQVSRGDRVRITRARVQESFGLTELAAAEIEVIGEGEPFDYLTLSTADLAQDARAAESYEGMALRFDDVTITAADADGTSNFGEFAFSSDTAQNQLRARSGVSQSSQALPRGSEIFEGGESVSFIRGIWTYSFSNYKLLPESEADFGVVVSDEPGATPLAVQFDAAYPNPVAGTATLAYTLAQGGAVRLEVFDVIGRRVAVLVNGEQAAGPQRATLDASGLASGIYLVRLSAGDEVQTRRVIVAH